METGTVYFIILMVSLVPLFGFSLSEVDLKNLTTNNVDWSTVNMVKEYDVIRQLLNQETIIRMSLVKDVHSLMKDMVVLKQDMVTLNNHVENVTKQEIVTLSDVKNLQKENERFKNENMELRHQLASVNGSVNHITLNVSDMRESIVEFKRHSEQTSGIMDHIKTEIQYTSIMLVNLNDNVSEMKRDFPKQLQEQNRTIMKSVDIEFDILRGKQKEANDRHNNLIAELNVFTENITINSDMINITINGILSDVEMCKENQERFSSTVSALQLSHLKKGVGFTAAITSESTDWSGSTLVFNTVLYEVGGGYSSSTGIFTSPFDGTFVFYLSIQSAKKTNLQLDIEVNGEKKVRADAFDKSSSETFQTGTNMVLIRLQQGDKVKVVRSSGSGYYSSNPPVMTFSGFLIS